MGQGSPAGLQQKKDRSIPHGASASVRVAVTWPLLTVMSKDSVGSIIPELIQQPKPHEAGHQPTASEGVTVLRYPAVSPRLPTTTFTGAQPGASVECRMRDVGCGMACPPGVPLERREKGEGVQGGGGDSVRGKI